MMNFKCISFYEMSIFSQNLRTAANSNCVKVSVNILFIKFEWFWLVECVPDANLIPSSTNKTINMKAKMWRLISRRASESLDIHPEIWVKSWRANFSSSPFIKCKIMGRLASDTKNDHTTWDKLSYWVVNLSSAFLLSASHNVLYFVLDIRTPVIHFLHNFNTFILLLVCQLVTNPKSFGRSVSEKLDEKSTGTLQKCLTVLLPPALLQLLATTLSSRIHSQNQGGSLYLLRWV